MKRISLLAFFIFSSVLLSQAQEVCRRTSVYFATDKFSLSKDAKEKIDSLIETSNESELLVELYGHTDTVGNMAYNQKLASQRIQSVREYFSKKATVKIKFKEKNLTETNYPTGASVDEVLAYNRCVDIYLLALKDGRIGMKGNRGEFISVPENYFEPCGVCASKPRIRSYLNGTEAARDNITLQTTDGQNLITGGMIGLDCNPCAEKKKSDSSGCITFEMTVVGNPPCPMTTWAPVVKDNKTYWEPSPEKTIYLPAEKKLTVCSDKTIINFDCPGDKIEPLLIDTAFRIDLPATADFIRTSAYEKKTTHFTSREKTVPLTREQTNLTLRFVARKDGDYYFHSGIFRQLHPEPEKTTTIPPPTTKTVFIHPPLSDFEKLQFSDTSLVIKSGEQKSAGTFGFFIPGYNEFIPIDSIADKKYFAKIPATEFQYAFLKRNKVYTISRDALKEKYSRRKNQLRVKIHRRQKQKFRKTKEFFMTGAAS